MHITEARNLLERLVSTPMKALHMYYFLTACFFLIPFETNQPQ